MSKIAAVVSLIIGFLMGVVVNEKLLHHNISSSQPIPASISGAASEPGAPMARPQVFQSKYVGTWVGDSNTNNGRITLSTDGSGFAAGGVWTMSTFQWKEQGDSVEFIGWKGWYQHGKLSPDGKGIELSGPGMYPVMVFKEQ